MVNLTKSVALLALVVTGGMAFADSPLHDVLERTRAEKVKIFTDREFGRRVVERPAKLTFEPVGAEREMVGGKAIRRQVRISYEGPYGKDGFVLTAFLPKDRPVAPAFLLVDICPHKENMADPDRVVCKEYWPVEEIVARGYATVMFNVWDVAPDWNSGCTEGVFACFEKKRSYRPTNSWGTLSAWAWAASRVMDWIETEPRIDAKKVAVVGHSRGGKTAIWTAVTDERFAYACSNDSGCGGAKLNHHDVPGAEKIADIVKFFPYWFCMDYVKCVNRDAELDFDQHELLSCVAPRLLAVGSAEGDKWAGPAAERHATELARPAWGENAARVNYHIRPGRHDLLLSDWNAYMDHAAAHGW